MASDHRKNPNLLWVIVGTIFVIILVSPYIWFSSHNNATLENRITSTISPSSQTKITPEIQTTSETIALDHTRNPLVTEDILNLAISKNESLAKEEIAKLNDIQKQLEEQEQTLKAQHRDADELIKLKEEQINILKQQLNEVKS